MKLVEVVDNEEWETEKSFRKLILEFSKILDVPFKKKNWGEGPNPYHLESQDAENRIWVIAHLISDEDENYIELQAMMLDKDEATKNKILDVVNRFNNTRTQYYKGDPGPTGFWKAGDIARHINFRIYLPK